MSNIIENVIELCGNMDEVNRVIKTLGKFESKESKFDFNKIIPIPNQDKDDVDMNDYLNLCLNLYMKEKDIDEIEFIKTIEFVGHTRKNPYEFKKLTDKEIEMHKGNIKNKEEINKMLIDAESFINKIKTKAIFNGSLIRDAFWSTGSKAMDVNIKNNRITFKTYDKVPICIVKEFASLYPNIKIYYTAMIKDSKRFLKNKYLFFENRCKRNKKRYA